jgi:hypothetical protein
MKRILVVALGAMAMVAVLATSASAMITNSHARNYSERVTRIAAQGLDRRATIDVLGWKVEPCQRKSADAIDCRSVVAAFAHRRGVSGNAFCVWQNQFRSKDGGGWRWQHTEIRCFRGTGGAAKAATQAAPVEPLIGEALSD